jgi:hypothetical protein
MILNYTHPAPFCVYPRTVPKRRSRAPPHEHPTRCRAAHECAHRGALKGVRLDRTRPHTTCSAHRTARSGCLLTLWERDPEHGLTRARRRLGMLCTNVQCVRSTLHYRPQAIIRGLGRGGGAPCSPSPPRAPGRPDRPVRASGADPIRVHTWPTGRSGRSAAKYAQIGIRSLISDAKHFISHVGA